MSRWILRGVRWSGRIAGLMLLAMVLLFALGAGIPNPLGQPLPVQIELGAMVLMVVGMLAGWRWEFWGGALGAVGFVLFCAAEWSANGQLPGGAIPLFLVLSVLLLAAAGLEAATRRPRPAGPAPSQEAGRG